MQVDKGSHLLFATKTEAAYSINVVNLNLPLEQPQSLDTEVDVEAFDSEYHFLNHLQRVKF